MIINLLKTRQSMLFYNNLQSATLKLITWKQLQTFHSNLHAFDSCLCVLGGKLGNT